MEKKKKKSDELTFLCETESIKLNPLWNSLAILFGFLFCAKCLDGENRQLDTVGRDVKINCVPESKL